MSDESEESCLVSAKSTVHSPRLVTSGAVPPSGGSTMPYTDGYAVHNNSKSPSSTGSDYAQQQAATSAAGDYVRMSVTASAMQHEQQQQQQQQQQHDQQASTAQQRGRGSQQSHALDAGDLMDFNEDIVLSQFHADAMKQAGCGRFQLIVAIVAGFVLCGHSLQVYSVFYILPSAEKEYCIRDTEKSWLANITLLGLGVGSIFWGGLAGRTGRRKTLLSCLGVSSVFSVVAAFMPTYGPFMMARFTSAIGFGGAVPAAIAYVCEVTPPAWRARMVAVVSVFGLCGALMAGSIAMVVVPLTGQQVMLENREHFSAWHRYLLLVTLPTVAAVLGLFWLPESPRYLLECGREVEALAIYQRIYRENRLPGAVYALAELEMPTVRNQRHAAPASVLAGMAHSVNMFWGSFAQQFGERMRRETLLMLVAWTAAVFAYHGLTVFVVEYSKHLETVQYAARTRTEWNRTYESVDFNASIENVVFAGCRFENCTFRRVFLNHVVFANCTLDDTEFANVKTSETRFVDSMLEDVRLIDTDLTDRHFVNCTSNNTAIARLLGSCDEDFEFNIFMDNLWFANYASVMPTIMVVALAGEVLQRADKTRVALACFVAAIGLTMWFASVQAEHMVLLVGGNLQGFCFAGLVGLALIVAESYATPLRSSALGLFMCGGHIGALCGSALYVTLPLTGTTVAATVTAIALLPPAAAAFFLRDSCALI